MVTAVVKSVNDRLVQAAGLVDTLKGAGPFTVFAPTDEAFAKLPAGTVEDLLKPENKAKLAAILTYHVVPGKVMAKDVVKLHSAKTVNGGALTVKTEMGSVMVDNAKVVEEGKTVTRDLGGRCVTRRVHARRACLLGGVGCPQSKRFAFKRLRARLSFEAKN